MNNVNTLNTVDTKQKKSNSFSKLPYVLALCTMLNIANPTEMKADNITNDNLPGIEVVSDSDIIANIERRTGTKLPDLYNKKLKTFITTNRIMQDEGSARFTADFIVKQMQSDRGISKQSQLLFIRTHIHNEITDTYLYDGSDGDEDRLNEYSNVMDRAEKCGKDFRNSYIAYTKQRSAEADRRSAEADRRSAEARQQSIEATHTGLKQIVDYYYLCKKHPSTVNKKELEETKKYAKHVIQNCKEFGIDYKAKLSKDVLNFYGVE